MIQYFVFIAFGLLMTVLNVRQFRMVCESNPVKAKEFKAAARIYVLIAIMGGIMLYSHIYYA